MPEAREKRTKLAPKNHKDLTYLSLLKLILAISIFFIVAIYFLLHSKNPSDIYFGNQKINLEIVSNQTDRERGLSGRQSIAENQGMLFIFEGEPKVHCFWMKDMNFPIDILWLSSEQVVLHVEKNVSPLSYPLSLCPNTPSSFVLEVQAGLSERYGIDVGSQL